jgi:hypothetical protein
MADPSDTELDPNDEYIQSFVNAIESRFPAPSPSSSADPSPEPTSAAPGDEEPVEGQEPSSPEPAPTQPEPEPEPEPGETAPDEGEAPDAEHGQSTAAFTLSGRDYNTTELSTAVQVYDWFNGLNPAQVQAVDALLSGQYRLEPVQPQTPNAGSPQATPPSPAPPSQDEGEWLDPRAQQEISALKAQLTELQQTFTQNLTPVVQTQQQADFNARLAAINAAHADFQTRYDLPDEAMQTLEASIAEGQILPGLAQRHGSLQAGMNAALEMMFWTTPTYREPYVQSRVASQQAEQHQDDTATLRKQHLTALSGSGGSVPRREPVPSTPEDRHAAMVAEIAAGMTNGQVQ